MVKHNGSICLEFKLNKLSAESEPQPLLALDIFDNRNESILAINQCFTEHINVDTDTLVIDANVERGMVLEFRVFWFGIVDISVIGLSLTFVPDSIQS